MTNEEIRKRIKPFMNVMDGYRYDVPEAEQIQTEARKDEREKVIGEIEKIWNNKIFGRYMGIDFAIDQIFKSELNSLKQC